MTITLPTAPYNARESKHPWVAIVDAQDGSYASFGQWRGRDGHSGTLTIEASPGDVLASGQGYHDHRARGPIAYWIVGADGQLVSTDRVGAVHHLQSRRGEGDARGRFMRDITQRKVVPGDDHPF